MVVLPFSRHDVWTGGRPCRVGPGYVALGRQLGRGSDPGSQAKRLKVSRHVFPASGDSDAERYPITSRTSWPDSKSLMHSAPVGRGGHFCPASTGTVLDADPQAGSAKAPASAATPATTGLTFRVIPGFFSRSRTLTPTLGNFNKKPPLSRGFAEEAHTGFEPVPPP